MSRRALAGIGLLVLVVVAAVVLLGRPPAPAPAPTTPAATPAPASPAPPVTTAAPSTPAPTAAATPRPTRRRTTPRPSPAAAATPVQLGSGLVRSSGWWTIAFTAPRYPEDPAGQQGGLDARLVDLIDRAQHTLDVADYDFDLLNVAEAMARAQERGVRVRMVTDSDTLNNRGNREVQAALRALRRARVPIVDDKRPAIMHHKFAVVDGEWVATGSWNFTSGDTYRLNNYLFIAHSQDLAANYTAEFEKMFVRRTFGPAKPAGVPHPVLTIDGSRVENYFAPQDEVARHVVAAVQEATQSIRFLAFSFTHDGIGQAMLARARAGVAVSGVFETTGSNTTFSEYRRMKEAGLEVYQDGSPWAMHHKVIVIDGRRSVFGSFNFSSNADEENDENLLIVDDPALAEAFTVEYNAIVAVARNPPARER